MLSSSIRSTSSGSPTHPSDFQVSQGSCLNTELCGESTNTELLGIISKSVFPSPYLPGKVEVVQEVTNQLKWESDLDVSYSGQLKLKSGTRSDKYLGTQLKWESYKM